MSDFARRRTAAALLLAASLGLAGAADAHAGSRNVERTAGRQSVVVRLQEMVRGLWNGARGTLTAVTGAASSPGASDKPPGQNQARDGSGLDPHGGGGSSTQHP